MRFWIAFGCVAWGVLLSLGSVHGTRAADARPPNILFAFADDQSWLHTSFGGDPTTQTPNFDRVAREGVYFTHCFSACPSCTPSRSAVLTGQDIWRLQQAGVAQDFSFIQNEKGMFSFLGVSKEQIQKLINDYSIYLVNSSRINVASINDDNIDYLVESVAAVLAE